MEGGQNLVRREGVGRRPCGGSLLRLARFVCHATLSFGFRFRFLDLDHGSNSLDPSSIILFLHDSRDCPETAVSLLHQKRLGSGSERTKEKIKLLK